MSRIALVLGASGRFGSHVATALQSAGWTLRRFDRSRGGLTEAATGADLIVNGWNPPYSHWAKDLPDLTRQVIAAARVSGATVLVAGNLYVYGADLPELLTPRTPHRATHPLGRLRREMEGAYRDAGVRTILLRAGDFLDTSASGNWFDRILAARISRGRLSYPGPRDRIHAWAFLPDMAAAACALAERREALAPFAEILFEGHTLTGAELARAIAEALGRPVAARRMSWLPIRIARPFWPEARHLLEMRYLWDRPHRVDGAELARLLPDLRPTPLPEALRAATAPLT